MRKAQVSLELLIVTLVFLSALMVWLAGAGKVQASAQQALDAHTLKIAADRLAGAVNSVCLMGQGNTRSVKVFFPAITAEGSLDVQVGNVNGTVMLQPLEQPSGSQALP